MKQLILGIDETEIIKAEEALKIKFPDMLRKAWLTYNVIDLRGGWWVFPIFDVRSPRKTCSNIVYENTTNGWSELQPDNVFAIADNGSGNQLVIKHIDGVAENDVYHWHHETGKLKKWKPGLDAILARAIENRESIEKLYLKYGKKD